MPPTRAKQVGAGRQIPDLYDSLRKEIISGNFTGGDPLVETTLANRYGTSRTPIREALRRLEQDGLVERGARGLQVRSRSPEEVLEIYQVRIDLEGLVAQYAAERHTAFDLARAENCLRHMESLNPETPDEMTSVNRAFHNALWTACHNTTLVDLLNRLQGHLARYPTTTLTSPGRWESALAEHKLILEKVKQRDPAGARSVAEEHMFHAREIRLKMYAEPTIAW